MNLENVIAERKDKTVYRDGDKVIKVFDESYSKPMILNEALNTARVEETELNIPKLLEVRKIEGKWAIVSEFVEGKNLEQLMQEHPEKFDEYRELFVNIQLEILATPAPAMLNKIKEKMKNKIASADLPDSVKYDLSTRLEGMPTHSKLCHGDFVPSNILIKEDGSHYIIDWAHVTQGNAGADAARTYLRFSLHGRKEEAERYLDLFAEKSGIEKKIIQKWIPIVAASQLSKGKEEERDFLYKWADVIEFQ
ncbi:MAG: phosphotransferase [Clostridia bacterium]|nr:phosphotransferase [Clostridia bacterium]